MKVSDVMKRDVITVPRSASLKEAASILVKRGISGVPVVDNGKVVGVFSERDLLFKEQGKPDGTHWLTWLTDPLAVADRLKLDAHTAGEAMTAPAVTVEADANVSGSSRLMRESGLHTVCLASRRLLHSASRADPRDSWRHRGQHAHGLGGLRGQRQPGVRALGRLRRR